MKVLIYESLLVSLFICILIHIPRIVVEAKSRLLEKTSKVHGEDSYQKNRNKNDNVNRIFCWCYFEMPESQWKDYIEETQTRLLKLIRSEFKELLENTCDEEIISVQPTEKTTSYIPFGDVVSVWIDNSKQIIRLCFNHEWCSGYFFLICGASICDGDYPKTPYFPNAPFIPEYSFLKLLVNKPHVPISKCFNTNIQNEDIKRVNFTMDVSVKPNNVASRTYILWNVMTILNSVHQKDYNILIPLPFEKLKNISNNIGVLFVKWPKDDLSPNELNNAIKENAYTSIATNLYMRGVTTSTTGVNTRKNVDLVFTSGYVKNPKVSLKCNKTTFNGVADYGIYCFTTTFEKKTNVSLTFSTDQIDFDKVVETIGKSYEYTLF